VHQAVDVIIILEGPDGAGKSTMIEELKRHYLMQIGRSPESVQIWHAGPFPEGSNPWTEYVVPISQLVATRDYLILIDRWHLGELVYGPLLRGQSRLSLAQRDWIDSYLKSMGAIMVYLKASIEELTARMTARGDDLIKAEMLPHIVAGYDVLTTNLPASAIKTIVHDTTNQRTSPMAVAIALAANMEATIALKTQALPSYDPRPHWEKHPWPS
jgi:GTPase SAR1 family protein